MSSFLATFVLVFISWLLLTFSLKISEVLLGLFVSVIIAYITCDILFREKALSVFNPVRWAYGIVYIIVLLVIEVKTHLDVCYRIITGRISPAIIRIPARDKTNIQKILMVDSIIMTPGTLAVAVTDSIFIHWIGYRKGRRRVSLLEKLGTKVVR